MIPSVNRSNSNIASLGWSPIRKFNYDLILSVIIVFTATLHSIYFYQIKLAPFPVVSFLLLLFTMKKIDKRILLLTLIFYAIFTLNILCGIVYAGSSFYYNSLFGIAIGPLYFALFYQKFKSKPAFLEKSIRLSLFVHMIFFYFQFLCFYLFGIKINYLLLITGEESRVEGVGVLTNLIRCSGLCNEPASYSLFVNLLAFYLINIKRKINWMIALALLSTLLSFSVSGILFAAINIVYFNLFIVYGIRKLLASILLLSISLAILGYFYFDLLKLFIESRFDGTQEDASFNSRFNDGFKYFFDQSTFKQLTGIGIGNYTEEVSTVASGYMAIVVHLGYLFSLLFLILNIACVKVLKFRLIVILFFFLYLASTMTFLNVHYWMFFAMAGLIQLTVKKSVVQL